MILSVAFETEGGGIHELSDQEHGYARDEHGRQRRDRAASQTARGPDLREQQHGDADRRDREQDAHGGAEHRSRGGVATEDLQRVRWAAVTAVDERATRRK